MSNAFPPPSGQPGEYAPVLPADRSASPKGRWVKIPLWALIAVPALGVGAIVALSTRTTEGNRTVAGAPTRSSIVIATTPAQTDPPSTTSTALAATTASTPATAAATVPPTASPTTHPATAPVVAAVLPRAPAPAPAVAPAAPLPPAPAPAVLPAPAPAVLPASPPA